MQCRKCLGAMRRIGTYMNIVVWFCIPCDEVNDEVRDLRRNDDPPKEEGTVRVLAEAD